MSPLRTQVMCAYVAFMVWQLSNVAMDIYRMRLISDELLRPWYGFISDWLLTDNQGWNLVTMISVVLNLSNLVIWLLFNHSPAAARLNAFTYYY
jgi:hypothetical protein